MVGDQLVVMCLLCLEIVDNCFIEYLEYVASTYACKEAMWLQRLCDDIVLKHSSMEFQLGNGGPRVYIWGQWGHGD